jgi:hypothetical protein
MPESLAVNRDVKDSELMLTTPQGILHSRGQLILFADADGASRFTDLDLLLAAMHHTRDADDHGMVVGSRAHLVNSEAVVKVSRLRATSSSVQRIGQQC